METYIYKELCFTSVFKDKPVECSAPVLPSPRGHVYAFIFLQEPTIVLVYVLSEYMKRAHIFPVLYSFTVKGQVQNQSGFLPGSTFWLHHRKVALKNSITVLLGWRGEIVAGAAELCEAGHQREESYIEGGSSSLHGVSPVLSWRLGFRSTGWDLAR